MMNEESALDDHAHALVPRQKPLVDDQGRCLVCAVEVFTTAYDRLAGQFRSLWTVIIPGGREELDTPDTIVSRAIAEVERLRADNERLRADNRRLGTEAAFWATR